MINLQVIENTDFEEPEIDDAELRADATANIHVRGYSQSFAD